MYTIAQYKIIVWFCLTTGMQTAMAMSAEEGVVPNSLKNCTRTTQCTTSMSAQYYAKSSKFIDATSNKTWTQSSSGKFHNSV
jgi:hypothetical protein